MKRSGSPLDGDEINDGASLFRRDFHIHDLATILFAASGSGSVIGRDPLPPRAVSTSHLPQRTLTQPPTAVSTLPLPRSNAAPGGGGGHTPRQHSTPQHQSMRHLLLDGEAVATTQMLMRAASNGDIGKGHGM